MFESALKAGTVLNSPKRSYTICRVLGQGGFGITYLVESTFMMGQIPFKGRFAIKELFVDAYCYRQPNSPQVICNPSKEREVAQSKRAFISESQRLQRLGINHPNIVKVDEVFEANGTAYYVMEYLEGGALTDYVRQHGPRLSFADMAQLMRPICEAVGMLHQNRVAHYDIKPQNIMIGQDGTGQVRPVLIDFGLAKHYDGQGQATSTLAAAGFTPGYAPMEQYQGITSFAPTADVYALAATICFCLTGHAPAKAAELDLDQLSDELMNLGVEASHVDILLKALELRPTKRPANAAVFAHALFEAAVDSEATVQMERPQRHDRQDLDPAQSKTTEIKPVVTPPSPIKQRPKWLIPAIVAAAIVLGIGIYFAIPDPEPQKEEQQSEEQVELISNAQHQAAQPQPAQQLEKPEQQPAQQQPEKPETPPAPQAEQNNAPVSAEAIRYLDDNKVWTQEKLDQFPELRGLFEDLNTYNFSRIIEVWGPKLTKSSRFQQVVGSAINAQNNKKFVPKPGETYCTKPGDTAMTVYAYRCRIDP